MGDNSDAVSAAGLAASIIFMCAITGESSWHGVSPAIE